MSAPEGGGGEGGRNPLERTNIPFGGVIDDIKYRYRHYWSDIKVFNQLGFKGLGASFFISSYLGPCMLDTRLMMIYTLGTFDLRINA